MVPNNDDERIKRLVIDVIAQKCAEAPSHDTLRKIHHAIHLHGSKLEAVRLSGGNINYSYKIFVDSHDPSELRPAVFAKLSLDHMLFLPTAKLDLQRANNEYQILQTMSNILPDSVVMPLGCWDVVDEKDDQQPMKLLVTEWSDDSILFSEQFVKGNAIDPRIAPKLADVFATLHNIPDFDPEFNRSAKASMADLFGYFRNRIQQASQTIETNNRTEAYCSSFLGEEAAMKIVNANIDNFRAQDCLTHNDASVMNVLVESSKGEGQFGPQGKVVVCDWEMATPGPIGKDVGQLLSFPLACLLFHAYSTQQQDGSSQAIHNMETFMDSLLDAYCDRMMVQAGPRHHHDIDMATIVRNVVGWCGCNIQFSSFHFLLPHIESEEAKASFKDSIYLLGIKLMRLSFGSITDSDLSATATVEEIRNQFRGLWREEVDHIMGVH